MLGLIAFGVMLATFVMSGVFRPSAGEVSRGGLHVIGRYRLDSLEEIAEHLKRKRIIGEVLYVEEGGSPTMSFTRFGSSFANHGWGNMTGGVFEMPSETRAKHAAEVLLAEQIDFTRERNAKFTVEHVRRSVFYYRQFVFMVADPEVAELIRSSL